MCMHKKRMGKHNASGSGRTSMLGLCVRIVPCVGPSAMNGPPFGTDVPKRHHLKDCVIVLPFYRGEAAASPSKVGGMMMETQAQCRGKSAAMPWKVGHHRLRKLHIAKR